MTAGPGPIAEAVEQFRGTIVALGGGGSTANLLSLWRRHGVDQRMREAAADGTILAGISAGANCWFRTRPGSLLPETMTDHARPRAAGE